MSRCADGSLYAAELEQLCVFTSLSCNTCGDECRAPVEQSVNKILAFFGKSSCVTVPGVWRGEGKENQREGESCRACASRGAEERVERGPTLERDAQSGGWRGEWESSGGQGTS